MKPESKEAYAKRTKKLSGEKCKHGVPVEHNCLECWSRLILDR